MNHEELMSRRVCVVITHSNMRQILTWEQGGQVRLPKFMPLPKDALITGVHVAPEYGGLLMTIVSPEFPVVPGGERTPMLHPPPECEMITIEIDGEPICANCGKRGAHYVPASLGEPGFFSCADQDETTEDSPDDDRTESNA